MQHCAYPVRLPNILRHSKTNTLGYGDKSVADEIKMPVEGSHIMMFARSVGDDNPIYHDEEYAKTTEVGHVLALEQRQQQP